MLVFTTPGVLDFRAITTFGLSVKETANPIGKFGTGLKYAIAGTLRLGGSFTIVAGKEVFEFILAKDLFRGKEVSFVKVSVNGADPMLAGFTTELGEDWAPWMLFRELYSNTLDEKGDVAFFVEATDCASTIASEGKNETSIFVDLPEMEEVFDNCGDYFPLLGKEMTLLCSSPSVDIYPGPANGMYFRGILAFPFAEGVTSAFLYDIQEGKLSEDRLLADPWSAQWYITRLLAEEMDYAAALTLFQSGEKTFETRFDWSGATFGIGALQAAKKLGAKGVLRNNSIKTALLENEPKALNPAPLSLSKENRTKFTNAQRLLEDRIVAYTPKQLTVVFVSELTDGEVALVLDKTIYLSLAVFELSVAELAAVLLENWVRTQFYFPASPGGMVLARFALGLVLPTI